MLLKQYRQLSDQELAFHVSDSTSFQAFAHLPGHLFPKKSVLQQKISRNQPANWERINRCLLQDAKGEKAERGEKVRIDSTVTETDIHAPSDSTLCYGTVFGRWCDCWNPADAERLLPMLERHVRQYGRASKQLAVDGGYASKDIQPFKGRQLRTIGSDCALLDHRFHL